MKRYAQMIYMLSQCKDVIDNPAALFARMRNSLSLPDWLTWRKYLPKFRFFNSRHVNQSGNVGNVRVKKKEVYLALNGLTPQLSTT